MEGKMATQPVHLQHSGKGPSTCVINLKKEILEQFELE